MFLRTPLGRITIEIDGVPAACKISEMQDYRDIQGIDGRYMLEVSFLPDGKKHRINCCLHTNSEITRISGTDERYLWNGFYDRTGRKQVVIGARAPEDVCFDGEGNWSYTFCDYDFTNGFEEINGVYKSVYQILDFTKTTNYVFGVCWSNNCKVDKHTDSAVSSFAEPMLDEMIEKYSVYPQRVAILE